VSELVATQEAVVGEAVEAVEEKAPRARRKKGADEVPGEQGDAAAADGVDLKGLVPTESREETEFQLLDPKLVKLVGGGDPPSNDFIYSVATHGFYQPILVRSTGQKRQPYEVVAGRRRLAAAKLLGIPVPAMVEGRKSVNADIAALAENFQRGENVIGDAKIVWRLLDGGYTEKQIAEASGLKIIQVRALRDMRKLRPELIEAVEDGKMRPWSARMAARQDPHTVQQRLVDILEENGQITADDVVNVRRDNQGKAAAEVGGLIHEMPADFDDEDDDEDGYRPDDDLVGGYAEPVDDDDDEEYSSGSGATVAHAIRYLNAGAVELAKVMHENPEWAGAHQLLDDAITTLRESLNQE
jgi:ParB/RepB/Spo0J family partition protein